MEICGIIGTKEIVLILLATLIFFIIPVIALVDILKSEFTGNNKLIWVLVVLMFWLIGSFLYYFIGRNQKIQS
jgi:hypothetical protein